MPDLQSALRARLIADAAITAAIGTRVYPRNIPQDKPYPAVRYFVPTEIADRVLAGMTGRFTARVQFDVLGPSYSAAWNIARCIQKALEQPGAFEGVQFGYSDATIRDGGGDDTSQGFIHMVSVDLLTEFVLA